MRILWSNFADELSPETFTQLILDDSIGNGGHLSGGSGGVYVFKAPDGKRYTLKTSTSKEALKDEVFTDALYKQQDIPVPSCAVCECKYDELPAALKTAIKPDKNETVLFRISEYIEPDQTLADEDRRQIIKQKLPEGYVMDCWLANHDVAGHWRNTLIDKQGEVWRVDNGSTLRFRAKGKMQALRTEVSELASMKSETNMMREVFGDIQPDEIQKQVKKLLDKRKDIIELFYEMHDKLQFDQPEILLKIIINRLQYLHEHVSPELYPYSPSDSEACLDYSGAGVLVIAKKDGKPHVLIGKRKKHDWWGSFGGGTKEHDAFLHDTAARESNEELKGIYQFTPGELSRSTSHDLIIEEKLDLNTAKFRIYFVERPLKDVSETQDTHKEHDEFLWIPVDALLAAKPIQYTDAKYGTHDTLEVEKLVLHPPFALMLQQEKVQEQLHHIAKDDVKIKQHTRSRVSKQYPAKEIKDRKKADAITPLAERRKFAKTMLAKTTALREMEQRKAQKVGRKKLLNIERTESTQSDIHFKAMMGDKFDEHKKPKSKISEYNKSHKKLQVTISEEQERIFTRMLDEESRHPQHYVFYHAAQAEIGFLNDIFTTFRRQLEHQYAGDYKVLRALDELFAQFEDVLKFMAAHTTASGEIDNYFKDYQEMGLSVNPFMFGSDGSTGSATYYYFLERLSAHPPDIRKLFDYFAQRLGLKVDFSVFEELFQRYRKKCGGTCYQIFVDKECVDKVAYPAGHRGVFNPLATAKGEKITKFSEVMEQLRSHPDKDYIKSMQARLFLKPEIFHSDKVEIKTYLANPPSLEEEDAYQYALHEVVGDCMVELLAANKKVPASLFATVQHGTPDLTRQMRMVYQGESRLPPKESTDPMDLIPELLNEGNMTAATDVFIKTPSIDLDQQYPKRDYLQRTVEELSLNDVLMKFFYSNPALFIEFYNILKKNSDKPHIDKLTKRFLNHRDIGIEINREMLKELIPTLDAEKFLLQISDHASIAEALDAMRNEQVLINPESFELLTMYGGRFAVLSAEILLTLHRASPSLVTGQLLTALKFPQQDYRSIAQTIKILVTLNKEFPELINLKLIESWIKNNTIVSIAFGLSILHTESPTLITQENYTFLVNNPSKAKIIGFCIANLYKVSPELIEGENRKLLLRHPQSIKALSDILLILYNVSPGLINDEHRALIDNVKEFPDLEESLSRLSTESPSLITSENFKLLMNNLRTFIVDGLLILYITSPKLINDKTRPLLITPHAQDIARILSILHQTSPALINDETLRLIANINQKDIRAIREAVDYLRSYPALLNVENLRFLISNPSTCLDLAKMIAHVGSAGMPIDADTRKFLATHPSYQVSLGLAALYRASPQLVSAENREFIVEISDHASERGRALARLHEESADLVNEKNRGILRKHSIVSTYVADLLIILHRISPQLVTDQSRALIAVIPMNNLYKIQDTLSKLEEKLPVLITMENFALIAKHPSEVKEISEILIRLHAISPDFINEKTHTLLSENIRHVKKIYDVFSDKFNKYPMLAIEKNMEFFLKNAENAEQIAKALDKFRKHPELLTDKIYGILGKHSKFAQRISYSLIKLVKISPDLINDENIKILSECRWSYYASDEGIGSLICTLGVYNPDMISNENIKIFALNADYARPIIEVFSLLHKKAPAMVNNISLKWLLQDAKHTSKISAALSKMAEASPTLLNDSYFQFLTSHAEHAENLGAGIIALQNASAELAKDTKILAFLAEHAQYAEFLGRSLAVIHKSSPELLNDETCTLLAAHLTHINDFSYVLKMLHQASPSLVTDQNLKLLLTHADALQNILYLTYTGFDKLINHYAMQLILNNLNRSEEIVGVLRSLAWKCHEGIENSDSQRHKLYANPDWVLALKKLQKYLYGDQSVQFDEKDKEFLKEWDLDAKSEGFITIKSLFDAQEKIKMGKE